MSAVGPAAGDGAVGDGPAGDGAAGDRPPGDSAALTGSDAAQVAHLRDFLSGHTGNGTAVISYLGRVGARIVVIADDGAFGDAVVSSERAAAQVCERAGIPVADGWTRDLSAKLRPSAEDRRRMAGTGR